MDNQKILQTLGTFAISMIPDGRGEYLIEILGWDEMDKRKQGQIRLLLSSPDLRDGVPTFH